MDSDMTVPCIDVIGNRSPVLPPFSPMPPHGNFVDLTGAVHGRLTVNGYGGKRKNSHLWWCRCECGVFVRVASGHLKNGHTLSCGCHKAETLLARSVKHKATGTPEYIAWKHMLSRCYYPKNVSYPHYGARGITVCDLWRADFTAFLNDVGLKPSPKHSIDRIDNERATSPAT